VWCRWLSILAIFDWRVFIGSVLVLIVGVIVLDVYGAADHGERSR
jgi:hypothetical protein